MNKLRLALMTIASACAAGLVAGCAGGGAANLEQEPPRQEATRDEVAPPSGIVLHNLSPDAAGRFKMSSKLSPQGEIELTVAWAAGDCAAGVLGRLEISQPELRMSCVEWLEACPADDEALHAAFQGDGAVEFGVVPIGTGQLRLEAGAPLLRLVLADRPELKHVADETEDRKKRRSRIADTELVFDRTLNNARTLAPLTTMSVMWSPALQGDADDNGSTNISDLTGVGILLQSTHASQEMGFAPVASVTGMTGDLSSRRAKADLDHNGEINITDLTTLGIYLGAIYNNMSICYHAGGSSVARVVKWDNDTTLTWENGGKPQSKYRYTRQFSDDAGDLTRLDLEEIDSTPGTTRSVYVVPHYLTWAMSTNPADELAVKRQFVYADLTEESITATGLAATPPGKLAGINESGFQRVLMINGQPQTGNPGAVLWVWPYSSGVSGTPSQLDLSANFDSITDLATGSIGGQRNLVILGRDAGAYKIAFLRLIAQGGTGTIVDPATAIVTLGLDFVPRTVKIANIDGDPAQEVLVPPADWGNRPYPRGSSFDFNGSTFVPTTFGTGTNVDNFLVTDLDASGAVDTVWTAKQGDSVGLNFDNSPGPPIDFSSPLSSWVAYYGDLFVTPLDASYGSYSKRSRAYLAAARLQTASPVDQRSSLLFAYDNLPLFIIYSQTQASGTDWQFAGGTQVDVLNCLYEPTGEQRRTRATAFGTMALDSDGTANDVVYLTQNSIGWRKASGSLVPHNVYRDNFSLISNASYTVRKSTFGPIVTISGFKPVELGSARFGAADTVLISESVLDGTPPVVKSRVIALDF